MATRSQFGDLLEPGFNQIYNDSYNEMPQMYSQLFTVQNSSKQDEKDTAITGFGLLVQKAENAPITYEDPIQAYDKRYVHLVYAKGFKISRELYDDDQYNIMNSKPKALGKAARRTEETQGASVLNNAFSTSYQGGDAKPLCSTSHTRADAGTAQSNASATGITFGDSNYETAKLAMRATLDHKGNKIAVKPNTIVIPPDLEKSANILFNSNLRSGTADNDMNPYKGELKIMVWDYLTSTTAWFLMDKSQSELKWFWRNRPEFKQDDIFETDTAVFKVRERFSNGFSDWVGVWGSKGDSAAYAD